MAKPVHVLDEFLRAFEKLGADMQCTRDNDSICDGSCRVQGMLATCHRLEPTYSAVAKRFDDEIRQADLARKVQATDDRLILFASSR